MLTFDHILVDRSTAIWLTDESGEHVETSDGVVDSANRFKLLMDLPVLIEARYTVHYVAAGLGDSIITVGEYEFTVDLPPPKLALLTPVNGQSFETGTVPLEMQVEFFDFGLYNNRIHLYVDGELYPDIRDLTYGIEGLAPGIHEITVVLAQFTDMELPETAITVHVAVAQPGTVPESKPGMVQGLLLTPVQMAIAVVLTVSLLGIGIWLGRSTER